MSKWNELSDEDRQSLISLFIKNGIRDVTVMRNKYENGGDKPETTPPPQEREKEYARAKDVLDIVNSSWANFAKRLKDRDRATIIDWEDPEHKVVATHKMSYVTNDDGTATIFPMVQEIDGRLYDLTNPEYKFAKGYEFDLAKYAGDIVTVPSAEDAEWFTTHYKHYYPGFNNYKLGGEKQVMKVDENGGLVDEIAPAVVTAEKPDENLRKIATGLAKSLNDSLNESDDYQGFIDAYRKSHKPTAVDIYNDYAANNPVGTNTRLITNPFGYTVDISPIRRFENGGGKDGDDGDDELLFHRKYARDADGGRYRISTIDDMPDDVKRALKEEEERDKMIADSPYKDMSYEELSKYYGAKGVVDYVAGKAGIPKDKIEEYWNSGRLLPMVEAFDPQHFQSGLYVNDAGDTTFVLGAKKLNSSKTSVRRIDRKHMDISSDVQEVARNKQIYDRVKSYTPPNLKYGIRFLPETGVVDTGYGGLITYNALDTLAKYGVMEGLSPVEYLGLPWRETKLGRQIGSIRPKSELENRAFYNMNYFANYGFIPAESIVNDWAYNMKDANGESEHSKNDTPPLQHAFRFYKSGKYNPGEPNHTALVIKAGNEILANPGIQKWMAQSKYVDKSKQ